MRSVPWGGGGGGGRGGYLEYGGGVWYHGSYLEYRFLFKATLLVGGLAANYSFTLSSFSIFLFQQYHIGRVVHLRRRNISMSTE